MYSRTQQEANEEENKCVVYFRLTKSTFTLTDPVNAATNLPAAKVLLGLMVVPPPHRNQQRSAHRPLLLLQVTPTHRRTWMQS